MQEEDSSLLPPVRCDYSQGGTLVFPAGKLVGMLPLTLRRHVIVLWNACGVLFIAGGAYWQTSYAMLAAEWLGDFGLMPFLELFNVSMC